MAAQPFRIERSAEQITDLKSRLEGTRWLHPLKRRDWSYGTDYDYLAQLLEYWKTAFDWRAQEQRLNEIPQYRMHVDDLDIYFMHVRSGRPDAIPLLVHPTSANVPAFDLVIPSMPGFGFSDPPRTSFCFARSATGRARIAGPSAAQPSLDNEERALCPCIFASALVFCKYG
jgi:hypothetical protein